MQQIRVGTISAIRANSGTVDVQFPDQTSTDLGVMDYVRWQDLAIDAPVVCLFPEGSGEGICLGRYYNDLYKPAAGGNVG